MAAVTSFPTPPTPEGGEVLPVSASFHSQQPPPQGDDAASLPLPQQQQYVEDLQVELADMRKAFEEYIATTQDLEVNLDFELRDMHGKLEESAVAYETLTEKLKTMEPMLRSVELSLGGTKKRLKEEAKLRRTAEIAQVEAESRVQDVRDENEALREECEALRAELEHKGRENEQLKREHETSRRQLHEFSSRLGSSIQRRRGEGADEPLLMNIDSGIVTEAVSNKSTFSSPGDESYAEVLDELETVTEQLITTQQKLWRTEDQLRESEARSSNLQDDIRKLKSKQKSQESQKLVRELEQTRAELDHTKRELAELEADQSKQTVLKKQEVELDEQDDQIEHLRDQIDELEYSAKMSQQQISELEALLEESQEENIRLVEEIASLRIILQDEVATQDSQAFMKESISKEVRSQVLREANEVREKEINVLREQFKKIFRENSVLKEKMEKIERGYPSLSASGDYQLKKEVERLALELVQSQDEHKRALLDIETSWKKKLEQVMTGEFIPEDLLEEMEEEMKTAIDSAAERVRKLQADKELLENRVDSLERDLEFAESKISSSYARLQDSEGSLKASRDEILRLKKSNTHLTSELEYTTRIMSRMDAECERLTRQQSELKAELEVALQVIESGGMDQETVHTEEMMKAKEKVHRLTSNLKKLKGDYSALLNELEATRGHFLDAQETAAKQKELEIKALLEKIDDLEEALEKATISNTGLSKKLHEARQKQADAIAEDKQKRELQEELEAAERSISDLEKVIKESNPGQKNLQKELQHCKDALSSSRIENKRLEEEIEKIRSDSLIVSRTRLSRDPDPVEETLNRDPPSIRRNLNDDDSSTPTTAQLKDLTIENELLREKIARTIGSNPSEPSDDTLDKLKDQLLSKTRELRTLEDSFFELKGMLRATEQKLQETEKAIDQSTDESFELRTEVKTLKEALRDAHHIHSETAYQLEAALRECTELRRSVKDKTSSLLWTVDGVSLEELQLQIQRLRDEKSSLQHQVDDSKIALSVSEYAQERIKEELRTSQAKLEKSQANVRTLKEELKKLAGAFSGLRNDHEALLGDFKSSRSKKATDSNDTPMDESWHAQLKEIAAENSGIQTFASNIENKMSEYQNEIANKNKEIESLECNLLTTQEEARLLSKEITNLSAAFENAQAEYDTIADELDTMQSLFKKSREVQEHSYKELAAKELHRKLEDEGEQQKKHMTAQLEKAFSDNLALQRKLDEAELSLSKAIALSGKNDESSEFEKEVDLLQLALKDSQNEVKALKERCFELEVLVKQTSKKEAEDIDGSQHIDNKVLSAVFDSEEMQDLREQFNALIEENISLEQIVRQSELALTLAKDVEERNKEEMAKLQSDLSDLKSAKLKLQEEVYSLTVELESANEDHLVILEESRAAFTAESKSKAQSLQYQIEALTIENSTLHNRIQKLASDESHSRDQINDEMQKVRTELQTALELKNNAIQDKTTMQAKLLDLEKDHKLAAEQVSMLQKDLQNAHDQKNKLLRQLHEQSESQSRSLFVEGDTKMGVESTTTDYQATMEIFERINSLLASVDFLERHHEIKLRTSHSNLTSTSQKAEEIRRKIAFLTYAFQKEKKEHSDIVFQLKSAKTSGQNEALENLEGAIRQLKEKLEATEIALKSALDSEERHKVELDLSKKKYQESQNAALHFKEQLLSLQGVIKDSRATHFSSNEHLEIVTHGSEVAVEMKEKCDAIYNAGLVSQLHQVSPGKKELVSRLEEKDVALDEAQSKKSAYEEQRKRFDSVFETTEPLEEILGSMLPPLSGNLDDIRSSRSNVQEAIHSVRERLEFIQRGEKSSSKHDELSPHTQAELRLLKSQFQKLNEQSDALAKKVKHAEDAVTTVRDKQNWLKNDAKARESLTQELQNQIDQNLERNLKLGELTILMESRVNLTEASVEKLEHELSATKGSVEISRTGLLMNQGRESATRLTELMKQRMGSTKTQQKTKSNDVESDKSASKSMTQQIDPLAQGEQAKVHTRTPSSYSHTSSQGLRDDSDCVQTTSHGMASASVFSPASAWPTSLPVDILSVVGMDAASPEGAPMSQQRSISPFTLSLLSDNNNSNTIGGNQTPDTIITLIEIDTSETTGNDDTNDDEESPFAAETEVAANGPNGPILETRSDIGTEQRE